MILKRTRYDENGVFGELLRDDDSWLSYTLEHSYPMGAGTFSAKVPEGIYQCVRGMHTLGGMHQPFETFEIMVPEHTGILFHVGNVNSDSSGCVLLGETQSLTCIGYSQRAFDALMREMIGVEEFFLMVRLNAIG